MVLTDSIQKLDRRTEGDGRRRASPAATLERPRRPAKLPTMMDCPTDPGGRVSEALPDA
jgi:hypothetical protein